MAEYILIGVILWVVGLFFGFVIRGAFFKSTEVEIKLRKKLEDSEKKWMDYQVQLSQQVDSLAESLKAIQRGCEGAESQLSLMTESLSVRNSLSEPQNPQPPKDYPSHS
jgi:uncharacterized membrane-anchored protein YhcB (DUF1043 family)